MAVPLPDADWTRDRGVDVTAPRRQRRAWPTERLVRYRVPRYNTWVTLLDDVAERVLGWPTVIRVPGLRYRWRRRGPLVTGRLSDRPQLSESARMARSGRGQVVSDIGRVAGTW